MIEAMLQAERLLTMGMLDQAEALYQRAADADPQNAMAVVGLCRVASERGDDVAAYGHARRALEIDPQNALALRLEARLSEVLAARGEPVERPGWLRAEGGAGHAGRTRARKPEEAGPPSPPAPPESRPEGSSEDLGQGAQRSAFTRNPSMADHQRRMEQDQPVSPGPAQPERREPAPEAPRPGLLRRLLGR